MTEGDTYLKKLRKAYCEMKEALPTVKPDSALDIFEFTLYDIQALWVLVKDIVDEGGY